MEVYGTIELAPRGATLPFFEYPLFSKGDVPVPWDTLKKGDVPFFFRASSFFCMRVPIFFVSHRDKDVPLMGVVLAFCCNQRVRT